MEETVKISLEKAKKLIKTADHMTYVTYPMLKEKRIMVKILEEVYESLVNIIKAILYFEYFQKRIRLYSDPKSNFDVFLSQCSPNYGISYEELNKIKQVFALAEKHRSSTMEFIKRDSFVIMSDTLSTETINFEALKLYVRAAKNIIRKAENSFNGYKNVYAI